MGRAGMNREGTDWEEMDWEGNTGQRQMNWGG